MNTAALQTKRKNKEVEDMDEAATYQYLCNVRPDGDVELSEEETKDFESWLRVLQIPCPERRSL